MEESKSLPCGGGRREESGEEKRHLLKCKKVKGKWNTAQSGFFFFLWGRLSRKVVNTARHRRSCDVYGLVTGTNLLHHRRIWRQRWGFDHVVDVPSLIKIGEQIILTVAGLHEGGPALKHANRTDTIDLSVGGWWKCRSDFGTLVLDTGHPSFVVWMIYRKTILIFSISVIIVFNRGVAHVCNLMARRFLQYVPSNNDCTNTFPSCLWCPAQARTKDQNYRNVGMEGRHAAMQECMMINEKFNMGILEISCCPVCGKTPKQGWAFGSRRTVDSTRP